MEPTNYHEQTRANLADALRALGVNTVAEPDAVTAELIYNLAGGITAVIATDVHRSATAGIGRSTALGAFAAGWDDLAQTAGLTSEDQAAAFAILADCLATVAAHLAITSTSPYAPVAAIAATLTGELASVAGAGLPADLAAEQRRSAGASLGALAAAWDTARKADRS